MHIIETVIGLMTVVVISNVISHFIKQVPVSLIQIGLGLLVALFFHVEIELDTDWFLLLFIAPLLYSDAWRFPKRELWNLRGRIFGNAILLVVLTTVVGGFLIYLIVPELPLAVAFSIAAILSPTDPVAVQSIAKTAKLPANVLHLVAGESLINDASGLVAFKFALAAATVGTFSAFHATYEFFYVSIIGALIGAVAAWIFNNLGDFLAEHGGNDVVFMVVLQLFSPFIIYIGAETFHASGVIAVVVAGIISNLHTKRDVNYSGELHLTGVTVWNVLGYLLNGLIFVILGIELPVAMNQFSGESGNLALPMVLLYSLGTWLIVWGIRVLWTYLNQVLHQHKHAESKPSWRVAIISGLTGVRGAVTMAGVLSVPVIAANGKPFPEHGLMLFIASVTIILSLLAAVIALPFLSEKPVKKEVVAPVAQHMTEARAQIYVLQSAVREIEQHRREANQTIAYDIMLHYQMRIRKLQVENMSSEKLNTILEAEIKMRAVGIEAERSALRRLLVDEWISPLVFASQSRHLDRLESDLEESIMRHSKIAWRSTKRMVVYLLRSVRIWFADEESDKLRAEYAVAQHEGAKEAINAISSYLGTDEAKRLKTDQQAAHNLILSYKHRLEKQKTHNISQAKKDATRMELEVIGLSAQREAVQHLYDAHFISAEMGLTLRQIINFSEAGLLTNTEE
ncbi:MAG: Na+/H+ antiporter [Lactobacillaceae bacterium]|jgi:CPA1 family monovalent cation:H+ antiporter|nr:Na+/H+ antiporter [Lactobacillaceae bacterium]